MRFAASALSCSAAVDMTFLRAKTEQMADRVAELGPVEGEEVEVANAARIELRAHLGSDGGGDELARRRLVVEPLEQPVHPAGDGGAAGGGELARLGDIRHRQYAGDDLGVDAERRGDVAEAEEGVGREEELGDRPVCAGVELSLQIVEVGTLG